MGVGAERGVETARGYPPSARVGNVNDCIHWSECMTVPGSGWRLLISMPNAKGTSLAVAVLSMEQPTTQRLSTSRTTAP